MHPGIHAAFMFTKHSYAILYTLKVTNYVFVSVCVCVCVCMCVCVSTVYDRFATNGQCMNGLQYISMLDYSKCESLINY